jgi:hypothetical protein
MRHFLGKKMPAMNAGQGGVPLNQWTYIALI